MHLHVLGTPPVRMWDESIYAQISKEMVTSGQWILPQRLKRDSLELALWFEKPPLVLWLQALSMSIFGVTEFGVRLPSALAGVGTALLAYHIAHSKYSWYAGIVAGFLLLVYRPVLVYHHSAQTADTDMLLTLFGSLFVWWLWKAKTDSRWLLASAIAAALAVLTKGFAAGIFLVIAAPIVLANWRQYINIWAGRSALASLAIMLPWPLYALARAPDDFINQMIVLQVVDRATGRVVNKENTLFEFMNYPYFDRLVPYLAPDFAWPLVAFGAGLLLGIGALIWRALQSESDIQFEREWFLLWWLVSVPIGWSVLGGTYLHYLLPMVVPATIITGAVFGGWLSWGRDYLSEWVPEASIDGASLVCAVLVVAVVVSSVPLPSYYNDQETGQRAVGEAFDSAPQEATVYQQETVNEWTNTLWFYIDRDIEGASIGEIRQNESIQYAVINESNLNKTNREYTILENATGTDLVAVRF